MKATTDDDALQSSLVIQEHHSTSKTRRSSLALYCTIASTKQIPPILAQRTIFLPDLLPPGFLLLLLPGVLGTDGFTLPGVLVVGPSKTPDREDGGMRQLNNRDR